jgi:hypothetical protein
MDSYKFVGLKDSFYKIRKVFFILFPHVVICKIIMSIFKDFEFNIVINIIQGRKVNSLAPLLLAFADLLAYICHTV